MPDLTGIAVTAAITTTITLVLTRISNLEPQRLKRGLVFASLLVPIGTGVYIVKTFSPHTPATGADVERAVWLMGIFVTSWLAPIFAMFELVSDRFKADSEHVSPPSE